MITICFTYFRSLTLANLDAALYSVRRQDLSRVEEIVVVDNNTDDSEESIRSVIEHLGFPVPVRLLSFKHGDPTKTHPWSTNIAVREARTPWVFFTRADYLLEFTTLSKFAEVVESKSANWDGFVTANGCHLGISIQDCEQALWRDRGPGIFTGAFYDYTCIDAGVWMARRWAFDRVEGLDEDLSAWGHSQTHFQWKLHKAGVECVRVSKALFFHPQHAGHRDIAEANLQLHMKGVDLREMWARFDGPKVY